MLGTNLHIGVVEDRNDPEKLGRVRVRILGLHSPDRKSDIQIADLPFATVMQPPNVSTAGPTLSQLVEGTWVIVMFLDQNMQDPLILGSIPSSLSRLTVIIINSFVATVSTRSVPTIFLR